MCVYYSINPRPNIIYIIIPSCRNIRRKDLLDQVTFRFIFDSFDVPIQDDFKTSSTIVRPVYVSIILLTIITFFRSFLTNLLQNHFFFLIKYFIFFDFHCIFLSSFEIFILINFSLLFRFLLNNLFIKAIHI